MDDQEFLEFFVNFWELNPTELAELLGKKRDSVYPWLSNDPKSRRPTPVDVVRQLRLIHYVWSRWRQDEKLENSLLSYPVRVIYEQVKDRQDFRSSQPEPADADSATDA